MVVTFTDSGDKDDIYQLKFVFKAAASPGGGIGPTGVSGLNEVASGSATSLVDGEVDVISDDTKYEVVVGDRTPSPTGMQKDDSDFDFSDQVTISVSDKGVVTINRKGGDDGALDAGDYRMVIPVVITHKASGIAFTREVTVTFTIGNPVNDQAETDSSAIQVVTTDDYKVEEDADTVKSGDLKRIYNVHYRAGHSFQTTDELISGLRLKDAVGASGDLGLPGGEIGSGTAIAVKWGDHEPSDNGEVTVTFTDSGDKDDKYQIKFVFKAAASPGAGVGPTGASGLNEVADGSPTSLVADPVDVISDDTAYEVASTDRAPSPTGMQKDDKDFDFSDQVTISVSDKGVVTINRKGGDDGALDAGDYQMVIPVVITHKASGIAFTREVTVTFTIANPVSDIAETDSSAIQVVTTADYKVEEDADTVKSGDLKRIYNVHYRSGHSFQTTDELISGLRLKDAVGASGDLGLPGGKVSSGTAIAVKWGSHEPSDNGEVTVTFTDSGDKDDTYRIKFVFKAAASPGDGVGPTGVSGLNEVASGTPTSLVDGAVDVISDDTKYEVVSDDQAPSPTGMQKDGSAFDFSDQVTISVSDKGVVTINRKGGADGALDAGSYRMVIPVVITHKDSGIKSTKDVTVSFTVEPKPEEALPPVAGSMNEPGERIQTVIAVPEPILPPGNPIAPDSATSATVAAAIIAQTVEIRTQAVNEQQRGESSDLDGKFEGVRKQQAQTERPPAPERSDTVRALSITGSLESRKDAGKGINSEIALARSDEMTAKAAGKKAVVVDKITSSVANAEMSELLVALSAEPPPAAVIGTPQLAAPPTVASVALTTSGVPDANPSADLGLPVNDQITGRPADFRSFSLSAVGEDGTGILRLEDDETVVGLEDGSELPAGLTFDSFLAEFKLDKNIYRGGQAEIVLRVRDEEGNERLVKVNLTEYLRYLMEEQETAEGEATEEEQEVTEEEQEATEEEKTEEEDEGETPPRAEPRN